MLVLYRAEQRWEDRVFREFPRFLHAGDCLVLNDSKVFPSRLYGTRVGFSGSVKVLLLQPLSDDAKTWTALVHPGRKMRTGERVSFDGVEAEVIGRGEYGERTLRFEECADFWQRLEGLGHVPLPPYIHRADEGSDRERYQTVFARERGSVAAPTAGLAAPAAGLAAGPGRPESARPERGRLERGRLEPARPAHPGSEANPGHPGMPRRLRPVVQVPDDDDPLTSPSFPKAVSSDSRSYRNGRSAGPNGYHAVEPDIGQAATAAYSYRPVPQPAPGNYAAASYQPSGHVPANGSGIPAAAYQPERSAAGRAAPAASPPSGNPYGSYVSSDLPGYLENPAPSYHRARSESGYASYPAGAENGRSAAPYPYSSPAIDSAPPGDNWKSSWYPDAPAASAPAAPPARPIPLPQADLYAVPGTPDHLNGNGHYSSPGYAPGSYPDGRFDAPGYPPAGYRGQPDVSRHPPVPGDSGAQRDLAGYLPGEFYGRDDYGRQQRR